jgi:hypothetical protein
MQRKVKVLECMIQANGVPEPVDDETFWRHHGPTPEVYILFQNSDLFEYTRDFAEADIIPLLIHNPEIPQATMDFFSDKFNNNQIAVNIRWLCHIDETVMNPENLTENMIGSNHPFKKIIDLHSDWSKILYNSNTFLYTDFLFNRSHVMHFKREVLRDKYATSTRNHWYQIAPPHLQTEQEPFPDKTFDITPDHDILYRLKEFRMRINNHEITPKMFVAPSTSRVRPRLAQRSVLRKELNRLLFEYEGYIGDISQGLAMLPDMDEYRHDTWDLLGLNGWGFSPPSNVYYDSSTLSIYVETLIYKGWFDTMCATEKTFTPMVKGHFIMPFGRPKFIYHLSKDYGFKFPSWIDYTYDTSTPEHPDPWQERMQPFTEQVRWDLYKEEVKRILGMGAEKLYQKKKEDLNILLHNRSIMRDIGPRADLGENDNFGFLMA